MAKKFAITKKGKKFEQTLDSMTAERTDYYELITLATISFSPSYYLIVNGGNVGTGGEVPLNKL